MVAAAANPSQTVPPVTGGPPTGATYAAAGAAGQAAQRPDSCGCCSACSSCWPPALVFLATRLDRSTATQKAVPNVVGQQVDVATQKLEADGFKVKPVTQANTDHPNGQVFGQDPVGGQLADEGSTVTLQVSKGAGQKQVPNVIGQTQAAATSQLEAASFTVRSVPAEQRHGADRPGHLAEPGAEHPWPTRAPRSTSRSRRARPPSRCPT